MEPANVVSQAIVPANGRSCFQQIERGVMYIPAGVLCVIAIGAVGMAILNGAGGALSLAAVANFTLANTVNDIALANIAAFAIIVIGALAVCGCYLYVMPQRLFEEDIEEEGKENKELKEVVTGFDHSIDKYHGENIDLKNTVDETEKNFTALKQELDHKTELLLKLSEELKSTVATSKAIEQDFETAKKTIDDAKQIIASMMETSKTIKSNIKASKVALELFKGCNSELEVEVKDLNIEDRELSNLLTEYSKIANEEHTQFDMLMKACELLNETCQNLKKEVDNLSGDAAKISEDVDKDMKTTARLELLEKQLENISKNL